MTFWKDLRFAARLLVKDRWFTIAAAVALGLGIAVNAAMFTIVNAILLRDLPFEDPEEIVFLSSRNAEGQQGAMSQQDFEDVRDMARSFEGLALWQGGSFNLSDEDIAAERRQGPYISATAFKLIGVEPVLGRNFVPEDDEPGAPAVVMLGHSVWEDRYGSDPDVIGRTIRLNSFQATVVGVMPEGMQFPPNSDIWVQAEHIPEGLRSQTRAARATPVFGRLADGVTLGEANAELETIGARLSQQYPETNEGVTYSVVPFTEFILGDQIRLVFWSLMGAVGFVLLIACANVANLSLARSARRTQEITVRTSMGASRWRVVRQLLVESVLLAMVGGVLGLVLSILGIRIAERAFANVGVPFWMTFTMDAQVFAFLAAICLGTGIVFGIAPALHVSKTDVAEVLKEGGRSAMGSRRARRWTSMLIMAQLAMTLVLLAGAGYMMRSFLVLYSQDLGIETDSLLTAQVLLPDRQYPTVEERAVFFSQVEERLYESADVEAATFTSNAPLRGGAGRELLIDGREPPPEDNMPTVTTVAISPTYFETLGLDLARGRVFDARDGQTGYENVIVNQRFVTLHFPGEDPIGARIRFVDGEDADGGPQWLTIVGIAPTVRQADIQDPQPDPVVFVPHRLHTQYGHVLIVKGRGDTARLTETVRDVLRAVDPDLPLFNFMTMDAYMAETRWAFRVFGSMFAIFAVIALVLSAVGLYSVTSYAVTQRTQEIGIRMALGARPGEVLWLVTRRTAVHLGIGMVVGMAGAFGVGRLLRSLLVQIGPNDPVTLVLIPLVLGVVAVAACVVPSLRATRLNPVVALRYE